LSQGVRLESVNSQQDLDLFKEVADYDIEVFGQLYDRYSSFLFSLINEIVVDKTAAEKILEEVFVILWKRIDDFDFRTGNVFTYLATLAKNKAVDVLKRQDKDCELPEYNDEYEREYIIPKLSPEIKSLDLIKARHTKNILTEEISNLTDEQKYVLLLVIAGGSSETEIAKKLSIPKPTVRIKLKVAFKNLHERVREVIAND
jgi:RNA polymerase sigma factor (sigma-70 family)